MNPSVIAVDIGTTSTKSLLVSKDGTIRASHVSGYPLHSPLPDRAEQDPEQIFRAVLEAIRAVAARHDPKDGRIAGVVFSAAMHSLIALDEGLNPLTPCIIWADNRGAEIARSLRASEDGKEIYRRTGTPVHPMSPLVKLMWLQRHEPDIVRKANTYAGIKEFVLARLFGRLVVDESLASATGLFGSHTGDWDAAALAAAGIGRDKLPEIVPVTYRLVGLPSSVADMLGLDPRTPFVIGASDGVLANLGVGAGREGVCACTIGTSGAVRTVWSKPRTDREGRLFCYKLLDDYWVGGGGINNGGVALRWMIEQLAAKEAEAAVFLNQDPIDVVTELAAGIPAGSDGVLFLPFLSGERAPYYNANARGVFFGLSLYHSRSHMFRAVFEGVMYRIRSVLEAMKETGGKVDAIRASGGFARSPFWCQMLADMTGVPVEIAESVESSGLGAAMVGLLALGEAGSVHDFRDWIRVGREFRPRQEEHEVYTRLYSIFMDVYRRLEQPFESVSAYQIAHAQTKPAQDGSP